MTDSNPPIPLYKPNDTDCTLTAVLVEMRHNRAALKRIEEQTTRTNGRVTKLETENQVLQARIVAIVAVISLIAGFAQWFIATGLHKLIP